MPHHAWVALGSNLGPGLTILRRAWEELGRIPGILPQALASPYLTQPEDMVSANLFTNSAGMLATSLNPEELLEALLALERRFGRTRNGGNRGAGRHEDRSLDMDLLCYDELVLESPRLILPHPRMHSRLFVLVPLAEIAAGLVPPGWSLSVRQVRDHVVRQDLARPPRRLSWPR